MRGGSMRLLLGVSLCALASGCNIKSHHDDAQPVVSTPPLVQNPPGTSLPANANSGFLSATLPNALGAPLAFVVDKQTQNATITQYTNGNLGLSAPDISPTKAQDQVTFTGFFSQQTEVQAAGGLFATGTSAAGASVTLYQGQPTLDLQYSDFGIWKSAANNSSAAQVLGVYAVGNATAAASVPKTGSVIFTGNALGTLANTQGSGVFGGLASLTVNFATNSLTGSINDIRAASSFSGLPIGSVNTIGLTGSLTGSAFSGQTSVVSGAGTAFDISGATGGFGGGLYGPNATEAVGVFSLTGGNTQAQVIGSFGATQSFASNDISSTVPQISALPNGLPLSLTFNTGFVSATQTVVAAGAASTTTLTLDGTAAQTGPATAPPVPPASFVYYSNGSVSLQAPNIPYFATQQSSATNQTVQFAGSSFNQTSNATSPALLLPYGTVEATATSSVPGSPSIAGVPVTLYRVGGAVGLQYSDFGEWTTGQIAVNGVAGTVASSYGFYGTGVATPTAQMPTTGTALYTGSAVGVVGYNPTVAGAASASASVSVLPFTGVAEVNANFATHALTGGIVGLRSPLAGNISDVVFTGTMSGNTFSGTTAAGTNAANINLADAKGTFGGGFYGPNAKEITGTFSLTGSGTGASLLIGSFGAHK